MSFWNTVMDSSQGVPYGRRLVPITIDEIARDDPERICFSFPRSADIADGFRDINFRTFANAINKTAHFIHREIGRSSMFETVMYMGYPDVRHFIVLVALIKTGHRVLFSSHRNSVAGHADLIKKTECTILFHTAGFPVSGILEKCRMETLCMPELDFLLDDTPCDVYPYNKSWDEAKNDPCMVVHTSGSTGLPKPVPWSHAALLTTDSHHLVPPLDGRPCIWGSIFDATQRTFSALPVFQGAGIASGTALALFTNTVVVLGPPGLATSDTFCQVLDYGNIDAASCLPVTLEEIATRPDILGKLAKLKFITFVGGVLTNETGNVISRHLPLYNIITSTETSSLVQHSTDPEDWQYVCLNSIHNGIQMRPTGATSGLYELVFVPDADHALFQGVFKAYPRLSEYSMSDVYSKHPTKPHHWKYEGRKDDMIVFQSGGNFNPIMHQQLISSHPAVQNCILLGNGRCKPAAIIELRSEFYTEEEEGKKTVLEAIWPKVEEANALADTIGQLGKEYIIFGKKERPFAIGGKGTVQKKATIRKYELEIEELYGAMEKR
ncbi:acetyl-CoA synthetase-like protein [Lindgomyces ingoldianus]|uniref:Acetyl-CoA synthetase-like protein n=1 Tax=Lindgomyces ingoldianus TaxID=673940 RepID=A0ACB6QSS5_9PLEO|nr:acetyl-CoA synthetase-like protein [Lindgomyces ingoldianus]KAF2470039.1 acetyl-CoA synthetase-like protein [Lindgomyces ingoldianus]